MKRPMIFQIVATLLVVCISSASSVDVSDTDSILPQLQFYHRFSQQLKERRPDWSYLTLNTPEYHQVLVERDLARHGRTLATTQTSTRTFYFGNITIKSANELHYATIDIGSPMVTHLVALDTGSDLFWLSCECKACAPADAPAFQGLPSLNVYVPWTSNTSKEVTCGSDECSASISTCRGLKVPTTGQCTYEVVYGEAVYGVPDSTTSGTLFQDVIHLRDNRGASNPITTEIILGCGQTQTGSLVYGTNVPDGLIGLGTQSFSVPSTLAASGIVGNSFSVCFNFDGSGRVVFGDFGSPAQSSTPFLSEQSYYVGVDAITVGNESITVGQAIVVDTGTTVTFLQTAVYKAVLASFAKQIISYQMTAFAYNTFKLCFAATSLQPQDIPVVAFELRGGASFPVLVPIVQYLFLTNNSLAGFCLAVLDSGTGPNILSVNFMAGYNLVFNREQLTLGFNRSDCYSTVTSSSSGFPGSATSPSRVPSPSLSLLAILSAGLLVNFVLH